MELDKGTGNRITASDAAARQTFGERNTAGEAATILTLIRRGASVERISTMLHVNRNEVEEVMDWYVDRMMA